MRRGRGRSRALLVAAPLALLAGATALLWLRPAGAPAEPLPAPAPAPPPFTRGAVGPERVEFADGAFAAGVGGFRLVFAAAGDSGARAARLRLTIDGSGSPVVLEAELPPGTRTLSVPCPGLTGFEPASLRLSWQDGAPGRELAAVLPLAVAPGDPITADLGVVLHYRPTAWRDPDVEVFRWESLPSILVFDTASYEVQDGMFKRLAFFVEKKGWTGTIPTFDAIAGLHGFNAHDYRAEDLARFFATAERMGVDLHPGEQRLLAILLAAGVVERAHGSLRGVEGGALSISRSSTTELRRRFLTHEALHGLYFSSERFRAGAAAVWDSRPAELKEFFRLYLSWPDWSYDLDNPYLLVNEFMAYLLQYPEDRALAELYDRGVVWLEGRFPARTAWLQGFRRDGRAMLLDAYRSLETLLRRETGLAGGNLAIVRVVR